MASKLMTAFVCDGCGKEALAANEDLMVPSEDKSYGDRLARVPKSWTVVFVSVTDEWAHTAPDRVGHVCSTKCAVLVLKMFIADHLDRPEADVEPL